MKRGFSLAEVVISCSLMGLALVAVFEMFGAGSVAFRKVTGRQGLELDARRAMKIFDQDVRRSATEGVSQIHRMAAGLDRDGVCLVGLSDWTSAARYAPDGRPLWDQYVVLYATQASPGRLVRQLYRPAGAPYTGPWGAWSALGQMREDPAGNVGATFTSTLSQQVESLQVRPLTGSAGLRVILRLVSGDRKHVLDWKANLPCLNSSPD